MTQKTLKDFMEVYKPKSPDEQKFVDKHVVIKHKDRNGNDDDVFKATNIKTIDRKSERHGYDVGEDEKVYEELKGDQHKIDANKNGKIDAHDFKLLRAKKAGGKWKSTSYKTPDGKWASKDVKEEVEDLDEAVEVKYKNYTISSGPRVQGGEAGDIKHSIVHPKKMGTLGIEHDEDGDYGETRRVTVRNNSTGETSHHHVYQREWDKKSDKPIVSIRSIGKVLPHSEKHSNVLSHYLAGKTKIKEESEEAEIEALLDEALDMLMSIDEKHLTPAEMKKREEVVKAIKRGNPKMDKSMAYAIATKTAKRVAEEVEELDELSRDTLRRYRMKAKSIGDNEKGDIGYRSKGRELAGRKTYGGRLAGIKKAKVMASEEVEELDELSVDKLDQYRSAARRDLIDADANDDNKLYNKRAKGYRAASKLVNKKLAKEETEIDEGKWNYPKHMTKTVTTSDMDTTNAARNREERKAFRKKVKAKAHAALMKGVRKEEVEDLDESAKIAAHLIKRYGDNVRKSHVRSAANDFGVGYVALSHAVRKKLGVNRLEEEQIDEISPELAKRVLVKRQQLGAAGVKNSGLKSDFATRGKIGARLFKRAGVPMAEENGEVQIDELSKKKLGQYVNKAASDMVKTNVRVASGSSKNFFKDIDRAGRRQSGIDKAVRRLTKEDIINSAINKYVPEEIKYTPEESFLRRLEGISEAHIKTLLGLFEQLNNDNKQKMIDTVDTLEGVNQLLNFALENRGE